MTAAALIAEPVEALAPVRDWRIHLGAHKTATTHLQETLAAIRPQMVARGVDPIPSVTIRASGLAQALNRRRSLVERLAFVRARRTRRLLEEMITPLREGPDTLVVSEEKLIGTPRRVFDAPLYPGIERIVAPLATLRETADLTFFLSIRSFATQLPSTYAQELRVLPPPEGGFAAIRHRALARPPSWFDLVARIRRAAPGVPLVVWCQEDYRAHRPAIAAVLCGTDPGPLPELEDPRDTRSPSAAAIARAEALPRTLPAKERRAVVNAIYAGSDPDAPRFRPFSQADRRLLGDAYAADLERIDAIGPGVLLLRF